MRSDDYRYRGMRKVTCTQDYIDLVEEHTYIYKFINEQTLAEPLLRFYELRMTEIEREIEHYNQTLLTS